MKRVLCASLLCLAFLAQPILSADPPKSKEVKVVGQVALVGANQFTIFDGATTYRVVFCNAQQGAFLAANVGGVVKISGFVGLFGPDLYLAVHMATK